MSFPQRRARGLQARCCTEPPSLPPDGAARLALGDVAPLAVFSDLGPGVCGHPRLMCTRHAALQRGPALSGRGEARFPRRVHRLAPHWRAQLPRLQTPVRTRPRSRARGCALGSHCGPTHGEVLAICSLTLRDVPVCVSPHFPLGCLSSLRYAEAPTAFHTGVPVPRAAESASRSETGVLSASAVRLGAPRAVRLGAWARPPLSSPPVNARW